MIMEYFILYDLQVVNKIILLMAIKNNNFSTHPKIIQDDIINSQVENKLILNHLTALFNEFKKKQFIDLREITSITQLAALIVSDYSKLFDEFIELKDDTNLEVIFKEKREQKEYIEFWNLVPGK
ncbi:zinc finger BED domain-containing protein 5-like [Aphis craccivora]|uniref:Zinc finger BED domain-containing protein 5-like n=1 Tax=Aphis craccivora TaxID=307492 RepID=A0A6G0Z8M5_APHCR|nr:zinc finger BED domain-containing protein 5-like [Aphis craccivora]